MLVSMIHIKTLMNKLQYDNEKTITWYNLKLKILKLQYQRHIYAKTKTPGRVQTANYVCE